MSKLRIWHSSRDVYHCAFRMLCLLEGAKGSLDLERLRIVDMYLLYPPLVHRVSMPQSLRNDFNDLDIPKPSEVFIQLPSAAAIAQDLRIYQNAAIGLLMAKGYLSRDKLKVGVAELTKLEPPTEMRMRLAERSGQNRPVIEFLVNKLAQLPLTGSNSVYRRSALPSRTMSL